jgi:hypothetical protein
MHPCGQSWVGKEFRGEAWFDFIGYQSGHGDSADHLRWLISGPPAGEWRTEPTLPVVNLEPNYETHPSYHNKRRFSDRGVRRAAYWSLLVAPTAGVAYGHNAIWLWAEEPQVPEGHDNIGVVPPWHEGLDTPGVRSMTKMRRFFGSLPWWTLRPAPELLQAQPGTEDPRRFVAAAKTEGGEMAVVYLPKGGEFQLNAQALVLPTDARWFHPRTGAWSDAGSLTESSQTFQAPDEKDWLLCIGKAR